MKSPGRFCFAAILAGVGLAMLVTVAVSLVLDWALGGYNGGFSLLAVFLVAWLFCSWFVVRYGAKSAPVFIFLLTAGIGGIAAGLLGGVMFASQKMVTVGAAPGHSADSADGSHEPLPETTARARDAESKASQEKPDPPSIPLERSGPKFPWPPPRASALVVIPSDLLYISGRAPTTLGEINQKLLSALSTAGHLSYSYYVIPDGFAVATRLEQINSDGFPLAGDQRWSEKLDPVRALSLASLGRAIFLSRAGYYRVVVFMVTSAPFVQAEQGPTEVEAKNWITGGWNVLPRVLAESKVTEDTSVSALIYELEKSPGRDARIPAPGRLPAQVHLERAGIWKGLSR
jgi:hypothetical protein